MTQTTLTKSWPLILGVALFVMAISLRTHFAAKIDYDQVHADAAVMASQATLYQGEAKPADPTPSPEGNSPIRIVPKVSLATYETPRTTIRDNDQNRGDYTPTQQPVRPTTKQPTLAPCNCPCKPECKCDPCTCNAQKKPVASVMTQKANFHPGVKASPAVKPDFLNPPVCLNGKCDQIKKPDARKTTPFFLQDCPTGQCPLIQKQAPAAVKSPSLGKPIVRPGASYTTPSRGEPFNSSFQQRKVVKPSPSPLSSNARDGVIYYYPRPRFRLFR